MRYLSHEWDILDVVDTTSIVSHTGVSRSYSHDPASGLSGTKKLPFARSLRSISEHPVSQACAKSDPGGQWGIATLFIFLMLLESDCTRFCKNGVPGRARDFFPTCTKYAQNM